MSAEPRAPHRSCRTPGLPALLLVLTLIALGFMLAACGGDADKTGDADPNAASPAAVSLATVADRTRATSGLRLSLQQTMTVAGQGSVPATAEGRFDTKHQRGEMTFSIDDSSLFGEDGPDAGALEQRIVFDGLTFYVRSPTFDAMLPAGKHWVKIDLDALGKQTGTDLGAITTQSGGQDPTQVLSYVKAASGDVGRVGTETVRGVATTHYKATIDLDKVPDSAPADQRAAARRSIDELIELGGTSTAPIEVWVDGDGLARRILTTTTTGTAAQRIKLRQRIELYDFGTSVDVTIPPAGETVDAGDLGRLPPDAADGTLLG